MQILKFNYIIFILLLSSCKLSEKKEVAIEIDIEGVTSDLSLLGEDVISTPLYERDIAIAPEGEELIYTLGNYTQSKRCLVSMTKQNGVWGKPKLLNISGQYQDIEPFYFENGNRLFFASNRPIYNDQERSDYNIWYCDRSNGEWSDPVALDSIINTKGDEFYPSLPDNGNLFFTARRKDGVGSEDIFSSAFVEGEYQMPTALPISINSKSFEFNAYVSPDEGWLVFSSYGREDGFGGGDLYVSQKDENGNWEEAKNMGSVINSSKLDYCPFIDWRTGVFYFTSERILDGDINIDNADDIERLANSVRNGFGNIYKINLKSIGIVGNRGTGNGAL